MMLLAASAASRQECSDCGPPDDASVQSVKLDLEAAFRTILTLPDCGGATNLQSCRTAEGHLAEAFASIEAIVSEHRAEGASCLSCDPRASLAPLVEGLAALGRLLAQKGYEDFAPSLARMEQTFEEWKGYSCCAAPASKNGSAAGSREEDARAVLLEKCGQDFVENRRGLKQVVRMPGDRTGCYQSRACRETTNHNGQFMDAGYWTYDGEYWYVWAERRSPQGEWVSCE
jgi:hypothetical protein